MKETTGSRGGWGHLALEPAGRCCVGDWPARESVGTCVRARDMGRCVDLWGVGGHVHACSLWTPGAFPRAPDTHHSSVTSSEQGAKARCLAKGWSPEDTSAESNLSQICDFHLSKLRHPPRPPPPALQPSCPWRTWPLHAGKLICSPAHSRRVRADYRQVAPEAVIRTLRTGVGPTLDCLFPGVSGKRNRQGVCYCCCGRERV